MVVEKHISRKIKIKGQNKIHYGTDLLKLEDVYMLIYYFNLTNTGTLFSGTIDIINRLFPQEIIATWEYVEPMHISKRILTSKMLGMHVNSDGTFIDNK
jgi:hypothetical protein